MNNILNINLILLVRHRFSCLYNKSVPFLCSFALPFSVQKNLYVSSFNHYFLYEDKIWLGSFSYIYHADSLAIPRNTSFKTLLNSIFNKGSFIENVSTMHFQPKMVFLYASIIIDWIFYFLFTHTAKTHMPLRNTSFHLFVLLIYLVLLLKFAECSINRMVSTLTSILKV